VEARLRMFKERMERGKVKGRGGKVKGRKEG
jgi:hypothetical protein